MEPGGGHGGLLEAGVVLPTALVVDDDWAASLSALLTSTSDVWAVREFAATSLPLFDTDGPLWPSTLRSCCRLLTDAARLGMRPFVGFDSFVGPFLLGTAIPVGSLTTFASGRREGGPGPVTVFNGDADEVAIVDWAASAVWRVALREMTPTAVAGLRGRGLTASIGPAPSDVLPLPPGARAIASVLGAFEALGGTRGCMERTARRLQTRETFGRPLITRQSLRHDLVDQWVRLEKACAAAAFALELLADREWDLSEPFAEVAAHLAVTAYRDVALQSIHLHGALGFCESTGFAADLEHAGHIRSSLAPITPVLADMSFFDMSDEQLQAFLFPWIETVSS